MNTHIMVCGDWHGDGVWAVHRVNQAKDLGLDRIIQCGDFGLWDHYEEGVKYLDMLNDACRRTGVKVYWLDGNHENHDRLDWYVKNNPRDRSGQHVFIRSHVLYSPRGAKWEWMGKTLMTVGGAVSIDRQQRTPGNSWWVQEQLTDQQVARITEQADYLFTHDCPTNAPFRHRLKNDLDSQIHRQRMDRVGRVVQPKVWFHGHMHERYIYDFQHRDGRSRVYGLQMNGDTFNSMVLNLVNGEVMSTFEYGKDK